MTTLSGVTSSALTKYTAPARIAALYIACGIFANAQTVDAPIPSLHDLEARINSGNYSAIDELNQYPPADAIQRLASIISVYTKTTAGKEHPEVPEIAANAIGRIDRHADHLKAAIENLSTQPLSYVKRKFVFELLQRIGTPEAVAVLGEKLWDEHMAESPEVIDMIISKGGDSPRGYGPNSRLAAVALHNLNLPTAPTKDFEVYKQGAVEKWREWWTNNADNIDELLASAQTQTPPTPAANDKPTPPPPTEKPTPPAETPEAEKPNTLLYVLLGLLLIAVIAIAAARNARKQ